MRLRSVVGNKEEAEEEERRRLDPGRNDELGPQGHLLLILLASTLQSLTAAAQERLPSRLDTAALYSGERPASVYEILPLPAASAC
jgi:hypothetical protein